MNRSVLCLISYNQMFYTHSRSSCPREHLDQVRHVNRQVLECKCFGTDPMCVKNVMRLTPAAAAAAAGWPQEKRGWPQSVPARTSRIRSDAAADKRLHERHGRPPRPAGPASCDRTERSDCPAERRAHTAALWIHEHRVNIQNYSEMCSYQSVWITVDMGRDQALFYSLNINSSLCSCINYSKHLPLF